MSDKPAHSPIPFDEFRRIVAEGLQVDEGKVTAEAAFVEDLRADSIQLVELMLRMEEAGIVIPLDAAWTVKTVRDAYDLYLQHAASGDG